jgi:hypothetical protein
MKHSPKIVALVFGTGMLFGSVAIRTASASDTTTTVPTDAASEDFNKESNLPDEDRDNGLDGRAVSRSILGVVVATVILYFGKDILPPLTIASILAIAFSPIASRLETFVGRSPVHFLWSYWRYPQLALLASS